jgi:putative salt-induced outer membrane protein
MTRLPEEGQVEISKTAVFCVVIALSMGIRPVLAQEEEEAKEPPWKGNLGLAYLATSGNTDTESLGFDFKLERRPEPWGFEVTALFNRAEDEGDKTAERYFVGGRAKRALDGRWELFGGLSGEKDEFSGFDLRAIAEAGAVYKALQGPTHVLSFDGGLTWTDEGRVEPEPDAEWFGAVVGLAYEWKVSDTASLTQRLVYYPNFDDSGDWRLNSDTGLQASISSALAVKVSYEVRYRNEPIASNDDTDTTSKVSLVVNF